MDQFQFLQSPVAAAREWWFSNVWKEHSGFDEDDMEDQLKDSADDSSSQYSENVVSLKVGIHCEECKRIVSDALWSIQGVDRVDVDKCNQKVTVTGKVSTKKVLRAVRRTGKCVELWKPDSKRDSSEGTSYSHSHVANSAVEDEDDEPLCTIM